MKEFLLSDESLNSHGTVVMTDGIRLDRFLANPVMFYNHDESKGVVGRWENIRKENGKLFGTPVFDVQHEIGRMLQRQVDGGFIRGASIGIGGVEYDYSPHDSTATYQKIIGCELVEVSVCDIPSNRNTLQLYYDGKAVDEATHKRLTLNRSNLSLSDMGKVMAALGLPENATIDQILDAIEQLKNGTPLSEEERIQTGIKRGYINPEDKACLIESFKGNITGLSLYLKRREQSFMGNINAEYNNLTGKYGHAFNQVKLRTLPQGDVKELIRDHFTIFTRLMGCLNPFRYVMDDIDTSGTDKTSRLNWTLDDYRKKDPMELKRNPGLYERLLKQKTTI